MKRSGWTMAGRKKRQLAANRARRHPMSELGLCTFSIVLNPGLATSRWPGPPADCLKLSGGAIVKSGRLKSPALGASRLVLACADTLYRRRGAERSAKADHWPQAQPLFSRLKSPALGASHLVSV